MTEISNTRILLNSVEEKFRLLLDTIEDFVFVLDSEGCFERASYRGAVNLGYLPNELRKKHITEIVVERDKHLIINLIRHLLSSHKQVSSTIFFNSKTFDEIKHQVILRPLTYEGAVEGIVGVCKNLSKEQQLQEKITALKGDLLEMNRLLSVERQRSGRKKAILEELNSMKNNFISEFSHEMRTPLSTIIGFSEAICSDDQLSESMKAEFQAEILREAKRLAKMINETLEQAIIESNKALLAKSNIDCLELLNNVILSNKSLALAKNISLNYDLPAQEVMISGDKERLADVFDALIKNSVKHTQRGGKIKIIGQIFPKEIELLFTDTGKGISHFDSQTLINSSNTVKIIRKAKSETGIGLDFAKKIVDLHNGYMNVQSEIDKGTTFIVKLPRFLTD